MEFKKDNMSPNDQYKRQNDNASQRHGNNSMSHSNTEERGHVSKGLSFVLRKSEKLTTALYMVTEIMSEREPMKWKMRETAVELLTGVTTSMNATPAEKMSALADVLKKIERMISFLEIAHASRMLSEMNASVLKREYAVLKTSVEYEWTRIFDRDKGILTENFFHVPEEPKLETRTETRVEESAERAPAPVRYAAPVEDKRHERRESERTQTASAPVKREVPVVQTQRHAPIQVHPERMHGVSLPKETFHMGTDDLLPERVRESGAKQDGGKNDRRTIILALIKQKPNLGVKDFIKSIPHVSEKTIQRELLAMVAEGVLTKKGERRWSTYSLPNQ